MNLKSRLINESNKEDWIKNNLEIQKKFYFQENKSNSTRKLCRFLEIKRN